MSANYDEVFDVIVIGAGIAGETCARRVARGGLRVALIERAHLGGEAATWAPIPSPTLLGPANARWQFRAATGYTSPAVAGPRGDGSRDYSADYLSKERTGMQYSTHLHDEGITLVQGDAHIAGPRRVAVRVRGEYGEYGGQGKQGEHERVLETTYLVLATGSRQQPPDFAGAAEIGYWTSREASSYTTQPASLVVVGGGGHAVELAQVFRYYGTEVTLITQADHLIPYEDPGIGQTLERHLRQTGIRLITGRRVVRAERDETDNKRIVMDDGAVVTAQVLVMADRRMPCTDSLGLENLKSVHLGAHGIAIDASCRAGDGTWAIGDVTGVAHRTHIALYQARLAADDILGHGHSAHYESVPRVIFTDPQVAATGLTLAQAQAQQIAVASATHDLMAPHRSIPALSTAAPPGGQLTLHADATRGILIGAWAVGADASEWIHLAVLAIRAQVPLSVLADTVEQFPPFSESYLQMLDDLINQLSCSPSCIGSASTASTAKASREGTGRKEESDGQGRGAGPDTLKRAGETGDKRMGPEPR